MKITRMEILAADQGRIIVFVKLHTDEGLFGVGEPSCVGKEQAVMGAPRRPWIPLRPDGGLAHT
ncbi:MAG: hypothetical protein HYW07_11675 [Candidatus Latescibacteria bacterium]|nr:hypothetical protein [Candidatus Latescibacterota bacterium]